MRCVLRVCVRRVCACACVRVGVCVCACGARSLWALRAVATFAVVHFQWGCLRCESRMRGVRMRASACAAAWACSACGCDQHDAHKVAGGARHASAGSVRRGAQREAVRRGEMIRVESVFLCCVVTCVCIDLHCENCGAP